MCSEGAGSDKVAFRHNSYFNHPQYTVVQSVGVAAKATFQCVCQLIAGPLSTSGGSCAGQSFYCSLLTLCGHAEGHPRTLSHPRDPSVGDRVHSVHGGLCRGPQGARGCHQGWHSPHRVVSQVLTARRCCHGPGTRVGMAQLGVAVGATVSPGQGVGGERGVWGGPTAPGNPRELCPTHSKMQQ